MLFWVCFTYGSRRSNHSCVRTIYNERPASRLHSANGSAADDDRRVLWDVGFIIGVFFSSLRVGDLQVAVCGLEALPGHNLLLKLAEGNMQPIESDCVVVQFGRKFIVNTRHFYRSIYNPNQAQVKEKNICYIKNSVNTEHMRLNV